MRKLYIKLVKKDNKKSSRLVVVAVAILDVKVDVVCWL